MSANGIGQSTANRESLNRPLLLRLARQFGGEALRHAERLCLEST